MKKILIGILIVVVAIMFVACDPVYKINFETNGGTAVESAIGVLASVKIDEEPVTTCEGYVFAGWYDTSDFTGERIVFPVTIKFPTPNYKPSNRIITLYAKWDVVSVLSVG